MRTSPTLVAFLGILPCATLCGQVTLSSGTADPSAGDALTLSTCSWVDPGPAGTNITWAQPDLEVLSTNVSNYVSVASTGLAGTYPNATVAYDGGGGTYLFYREAATGYEQDGFVLNMYSATCLDRLLLLPYPLSYGNTWSDNATCTVTDGSTSWARTMSVTGTADGWGSIILPAGTVTNVLRVHWVENMVDNQYDPPSTTVFDYYSWYRPETPGPVFSTSNIDVTIFGFSTSDSSSTLLDLSAIGMQEVLDHAIGVRVMPNPVSDRAEVVFGLGAGERATIELLDVSGRVVRTSTRAIQVSGAQREFID
ncbi:MAG TPA: hypothetical protein PL002_17835, partial [Flavobacteriales bacterium]|nr:hypothetical protein [Flavobacteriales bacterium]